MDTDEHRFGLGRPAKRLLAGNPNAKAKWQAEIARRVQDIQSGKVKVIPGEKTSARIRKIVGR